MVTSSRRTNSWLGVGMCLLKISEAMAARAGCATHVLQGGCEGTISNFQAHGKEYGIQKRPGGASLPIVACLDLS